MSMRAVAASLMLLTVACTAPVSPPPGTAICGDGRLAVDPNQIAIAYSRQGFTLSVGFKEIAITAGVTPAQVQKAEESTQNWNEFIKGVAQAHNACSGSKDRFSGLIERYAELKAAKEAIEALVKQNADRDVLNRAFERYFDLLSNTGKLIARIDLGARAQQYMAEGRYLLAIRDYEELIADNPRSAPLWKALGTAQYHAMLTAPETASASYRRQAIASFERCLEVDETFLRCRYNIAQVMLEGATADGPDVRRASDILDSLEQAAIEPEVRSYVIYYQGVVALLRRELRRARTKMLDTVNGAGADAFLRTFANYNLAIADCFLSAEADLASQEAASLRDEAVTSLSLAARVAESAPAYVGRKLKSHFRTYRDRYFAPIQEHPRWPEAASAIEHIA